MVELLARFDEEANINWAERLEQVGAQVVYGVFGLKTHAKLALLLRRERDAQGPHATCSRTRISAPATTIRARRACYTDFGLLTADRGDLRGRQRGVPAHHEPRQGQALKHLLLAPFTMHDRVLFAIRREARHAREGKPARIIAKMNALLEEAVIRALYAASQAGVQIDLDRARRLRACARASKGSPRTSACARSSAAFSSTAGSGILQNDGGDEVWLASADWMGRNLFRRIEVAFPVLDPALKARVIAEGLKPYLADNRDAWELAGRRDLLRGRRSRAGRAACRAAGARRSAGRTTRRGRSDLERPRTMDLILWRHAEAEPGEPDLGRRLTAKGIQQAERMAKWLDRHLPATTRDSVESRPIARNKRRSR